MSNAQSSDDWYVPPTIDSELAGAAAEGAAKLVCAPWTTTPSNTSDQEAQIKECAKIQAETMLLGLKWNLIIRNDVNNSNKALWGIAACNSNGFGFDDAIYAAIRLIDVVNRQGKKLSTIRSALPSVINTPELRLPCEGKNKFSMIEQVKEILREYKDVEVCDIDGVRVSSKYGWWLIRASNTQEIIVARCEATSTEYLENIKAQLKEVLKRIHLPYSPF